MFYTIEHKYTLKIMHVISNLFMLINNIILTLCC